MLQVVRAEALLPAGAARAAWLAADEAGRQPSKESRRRDRPIASFPLT